MSRQDTIAEVIAEYFPEEAWEDRAWVEDCAAVIDTRLRDARTVTTVAEVDALPVGTVIRDDEQNAWQLNMCGTDEDGPGTALWCDTVDNSAWTPNLIYLPATVLYRPEDTP